MVICQSQGQDVESSTNPFWSLLSNPSVPNRVQSFHWTARVNHYVVCTMQPVWKGFPGWKWDWELGESESSSLQCFNINSKENQSKKKNSVKLAWLCLADVFIIIYMWSWHWSWTWCKHFVSICTVVICFREMTPCFGRFPPLLSSFVFQHCWFRSDTLVLALNWSQFSAPICGLDTVVG